MLPSILTDHSPKCLVPASLVPISMGDPQQCIQARVARLNAYALRVARLNALHCFTQSKQDN